MLGNVPRTPPQLGDGAAPPGRFTEWVVVSLPLPQLKQELWEGRSLLGPAFGGSANGQRLPHLLFCSFHRLSTFSGCRVCLICSSSSFFFSNLNILLVCSIVCGWFHQLSSPAHTHYQRFSSGEILEHRRKPQCDNCSQFASGSPPPTSHPERAAFSRLGSDCAGTS